MNIGWEPRGDWAESPSIVEELCDELDVVHVVDIMLETPSTTQNLLYTRLHGLNEDRYNYDYEYSDDELTQLASDLRGYADQSNVVYCMFNNFRMYANAATLLNKIS